MLRSFAKILAYFSNIFSELCPTNFTKKLTKTQHYLGFLIISFFQFFKRLQSRCTAFLGESDCLLRIFKKIISVRKFDKFFSCKKENANIKKKSRIRPAVGIFDFFYPLSQILQRLCFCFCFCFFFQTFESIMKKHPSFV